MDVMNRRTLSGGPWKEMQSGCHMQCTPTTFVGARKLMCNAAYSWAPSTGRIPVNLYTNTCIVEYSHNRGKGGSSMEISVTATCGYIGYLHAQFGNSKSLLLHSPPCIRGGRKCKGAWEVK